MASEIKQDSDGATLGQNQPTTSGGGSPTGESELTSNTVETTSDLRDSLFSWGSGTTPSLPSIDERQDDDIEEIARLANASVRSSTASLTSSIYRFVEENGRTYHSYKDGRYFLPNDVVEQERLDLQHHLFTLTVGGRLYLAPVPQEAGRVLDIATGTGLWAIEFAMKHPQSQVIGTDLSPIQPDFVPDNCKFEIDDAEDPWTWNKPFDYIHGRALLSCFQDPKGVIQQAFDNLVPGGYLELQDACFPFSFVGEPPEGCYLQQWNENMAEALRTKTTRRWDHVQNYKRYLEEVGFVDLVEKTFYWPTSPWPKGRYYKALATLFQQDMSMGLEGSSLRMLGLLGWDVDRIREFVANVWEDFKNTKVHAYLELRVVYGRKPETASEGGNTAGPS